MYILFARDISFCVNVFFILKFHLVSIDGLRRFAVLCVIKQLILYHISLSSEFQIHIKNKDRKYQNIFTNVIL